MPKITRSRERRELEQNLADCYAQMRELKIRLVDVVNGVSFKGLTFNDDGRPLTHKEKHDKVRAALTRGHFGDKLLAKRIINSAHKRIEEQIKINKYLHSERISFFTNE